MQVQRGSSILNTISLKIISHQNTDKFPCDQANTHEVQTCTQRFVVNELQCKPEWFQHYDGEQTNKCTGYERFAHYLNLSRNIRDLIPKCFMKNCKEFKWISKQVWQTTGAYGNNYTGVQYNLQNTVSF